MSILKNPAAEFWNERYKQSEFAYGLEPSTFLVKHLSKIPTHGNVLFPAEGEGRNAVYAATKGLNVEAFDYSSEGKKKALSFAQKHETTIEYHVGDLEELEFEPISFDAVVLVYAHFLPEIRERYHREFVDLLKPGGFIILEAFNKKQLEYNSVNPKSGGPKTADMLFDKEILRSDFSELEEVELLEEITHIKEGQYHDGEASLIRFLGKKHL